MAEKVKVPEGGKPDDKEVKKPDETPKDPPEEKEEEGNNDTEDDTEKPDDKFDSAAAKKHIAKLNEENKKFRLQNKELKGEFEKLKVGLSSALGLKTNEVDEKVAKATATAEDKQKRILLKAAVVAEVAKDAHDPETVFQVSLNSLKDVPIDLDAETVDTDVLKTKLAEIRKAKPFLFQAADTGEKGKTAGKKPPDGSGGAVGGGSHYTAWRNLMDQNRTEEAKAYYSKNRAAIQADWPEPKK